VAFLRQWYWKLIKIKDLARYKTEMRTRIALFETISGTNKQIFLTLLTVFPMLPNEHSIGLVDMALTMDVLYDGG
jgi:hypothetical protein